VCRSSSGCHSQTIICVFCAAESLASAEQRSAVRRRERVVRRQWAERRGAPARRIDASGRKWTRECGLCRSAGVNRSD
jgi:hypothetical protein